MNDVNAQEIGSIVRHEMSVVLAPIIEMLNEHEERLCRIDERLDRIDGTLVRIENQMGIFFDMYKIHSEKLEDLDRRVRLLE